MMLFLLSVTDSPIQTDFFYLKIYILGASLAVQWLRLCLPNLGVWVQSLVRELSSNMPLSQKTKEQNRNNVEIFNKDQKKIHIKNKILNYFFSF